MLALVASGRGGGEGKPVFFTVPWSPMIAERGQVPGELWSMLMRLVEILQRGDDTERRDFIFLSDGALSAKFILQRGYGLLETLGVVLARRLLRELEFLPR